MQLTVLGTATPYPLPGKPCSGYLLQGSGLRGSGSQQPGATAAPSTSIWIDAGTGTLAELQRFTRLEDLDAIWISHRHADHTADLLVAYYALRHSSLRPAAKIRVIGPEALADRLAEFLGPDAVRGLHEVFAFTEMSGWGETVVGGLELAWGPVAHGVPAFALTVSDGSSAITYSGDTAPCTSLVEMAEESATLLCEVGYSRQALGDEAVHHTPEDAARTAAAAGVETIILTHLADDLDPADAVRRVHDAFAGAIILAEPGHAFVV
ncbi:MBL fold metallo-hydrolase [Subtercola frigoramans]|uniref:Ribonuclease BN (tRNA processing enzyme) n=1 Tax=Subtercola frigoramans TaxID=120298 RepID=A0ABS2L9F7_9MICO|nr:MBL fold metallo-hydrolase [Subtercola frigoramans]MBM7473732.1 ribonuclease BN (tRNA processing enzyme) [Subtercola frigoramans]